MLRDVDFLVYNDHFSKWLFTSSAEFYQVEYPTLFDSLNYMDYFREIDNHSKEIEIDLLDPGTNLVIS